MPACCLNVGTLEIAVTDGVCGNGAIEGAEQCDDGNTVDGDGCSASCALEALPLMGNVSLKVGLKFNKPGKDKRSPT